jgi:DNA-binding transcriptional regulator/RsmH inhibitor MraZ
VAHHLFTGNALCGVDRAGRLILPGFVRATLARRSDRPAILVGAHESDCCLVGYDTDFVAVVAEDCRRRRLIEESASPGAHHARSRRIFGLLEEAGLDKSGAVRLSPMMLRRARVTDLALVLGTGDVFEIWSPSVALESDDPGLADLAAFHLEIQQAA